MAGIGNTHFNVLSGGTSTALLGTAGFNRISNDYTPEHAHHGKSIKYTIILIIITAIIFTTVISIYDLIRDIIRKHYAEKFISRDKFIDENDINNETNDKNTGGRRLLEYNYTIYASALFAGICIILCVILVPILLFFSWPHYY